MNFCNKFIMSNSTKLVSSNIKPTVANVNYVSLLKPYICACVFTTSFQCYFGLLKDI